MAYRGIGTQLPCRCFLRGVVRHNRTIIGCLQRKKDSAAKVRKGRFWPVAAKLADGFAVRLFGVVIVAGLRSRAATVREREERTAPSRSRLSQSAGTLLPGFARRRQPKGADLQKPAQLRRVAGEIRGIPPHGFGQLPPKLR